MQVPTYPDGRSAVARTGGRDLRPIAAEPVSPAPRADRRAPRVGLVAVLLAVVAVLAASCSFGTHEAR